MKLINNNGEVLCSDDEFGGLGFLIYSLNSYDMLVLKWSRLSDIVKTMTGDSSTTFNTIGEMVKCIPDIVDCEEETNIICVLHKDGIAYHVVKWTDEDNLEVLNNILNQYFDYKIVE